MRIEDETENKSTDIGTEEDIPIPGDPESAKKTLLELWMGIIIYGVALEITAVWFFENKAAASVVFWIGIVTALCMAFHMYRILDRALTGAAGAQNTVVRTLSVHSMLRYLAVIVVLVVVQYRGIGSPVVTFFGIMGLKAGAYLQPFVHKAILYFKMKSNRNEVRR